MALAGSDPAGPMPLSHDADGVSGRNALGYVVGRKRRRFSQRVPKSPAPPKRTAARRRLPDWSRRRDQSVTPLPPTGPLRLTEEES